MVCNDLKIDLHIHSTASDGTCLPSEIVTIAQTIGLGAIAITDHDTVAGSKDVINSGVPPGLHFLTGIEISAASPRFFPCPGSFHILGYGFHIDDPSLSQTLEILQDARKKRNPQMIQKLNTLGFDITIDEVVEYAGDSQIGRPHIAWVMKKKGFVKSIDQAFDNYIGNGKPAYVDKYRISCQKAIDLIKGAGGIAVLAHPGVLRPKTNLPFDNAVKKLKEMGLRGIEVYYPEHSKQQTIFYKEIAARFDMLITGGTDFHGSIKPEIKMGTGKGNFSVPYCLYKKLINQI